MPVGEKGRREQRNGHDGSAVRRRGAREERPGALMVEHSVRQPTQVRQANEQQNSHKSDDIQLLLQQCQDRVLWSVKQQEAWTGSAGYPAWVFPDEAPSGFSGCALSGALASVGRWIDYGQTPTLEPFREPCPTPSSRLERAHSESPKTTLRDTQRPRYVYIPISGRQLGPGTTTGSGVAG